MFCFCKLNKSIEKSIFYFFLKFKQGCFKKVQDNISLDMSAAGGFTLGIALPMVNYFFGLFL
jgi:hypothetical protein